MKIAIDAMGGDHAPKEIVLGALKAIDTYSDIHITLIGDENKIKQYLKDHEIELPLFIQTRSLLERMSLFGS